MKEALREYGRTVAIFAAAGLVLSLLVGILAGNPFGVIVLRALLFAVAFGGVGAGMQYVVRRFLPELAGGQPAGATASADAAEPAAATPAGAGPPEGATIDIVLPEEPMPVDEAGSPAEPPKEPPGTAEGSPAADAAAAGSREPAAAAGTTEGSVGLDVLPDIGSFDDPAAPGPPSRTERARRAGTRPSDATRDVLERQDPALLARGLRTMLKRDERP